MNFLRDEFAFVRAVFFVLSLDSRGGGNLTLHCRGSPSIAHTANNSLPLSVFANAVQRNGTAGVFEGNKKARSRFLVAIAPRNDKNSGEVSILPGGILENATALDHDARYSVLRLPRE